MPNALPSRIFVSVLICASCVISLSTHAQQPDIRSSLNVAKQHLRNSLDEHKYPFLYPRSVDAKGRVLKVESRDWTSGYYPGLLWMMYEYTRDGKWMTAAQKWTIGLEKEKTNTRTHDVGLIMFCSFGKGYRLHPSDEYRDVLLEAARSLSTRYHPKTGCLRSWDHGTWEFPVIIDNMMNLELLFWATEVSGDSSFYRIAVSHADKTIQNHFREDNSSYHVVDYDTITGGVISRETHQGYSSTSAWSRGQAWGLYGFAMAYSKTRDPRYLKQAEKIADFYLGHSNMPDDMVPYWDFNVPDANAERDASAAAIAASGLIQLASFSSHRDGYIGAAAAMLKSLGSPAYLAPPGTNHHFLLKHSVGHKGANREVDSPLIFADYYYVEALLRYAAFVKK